MQRAAAGFTKTPAGAPIITPPAKVAFSKSYMLNLFLNKADIINVAKQLPVNAIIVFDIISVFS
jgi:hypothetical protein